MYVFPVVVVGKFIKTVRQFAGIGPVALQVGRSQPHGVVAQVVKTCGRMLKDVPVGIHCKLQFIVFNRTPDWLAIEIYEDRRRLREKDSGWIAFQTIDVLRIDCAFIDVGEYAIERDDAILFRNVFLKLGNDLLRLFLRECLKICLDDLDLLKLN